MSLRALRARAPDPGFREFVAIIASLMALNSMSIDPMLPALPAIGRSLHVVSPNSRQWVVTCYLLGLGIGSLVFGPISDRLGRRPVTLLTIVMFITGTLGCALAPSFPFLLAARLLTGFFAASSRVVSVSLARDRFHGDRMARTMSLAFVVFMIVPVIAPGFGQAVMTIASWRWIFGLLAIFAGLLLLWLAIRLPETLPPERRTGIDPAMIGGMIVRVVTHRNSIGYMIASGIVMGGTVAFITSVQQILADIFHVAALFPLIFAAISALMALGGLFSSRVVERIGARRVAQSALIGMALFGGIHLAIGETGAETIGLFVLLQGLCMLCVALAGPNCGAISMEPYAIGAGLASSFQAFIAVVISSLLGASVGQAYDGTTIPLATGFLVFGLLALAIVAWAESGRLFTRSARVARADLVAQLDGESVGP